MTDSSTLRRCKSRCGLGGRGSKANVFDFSPFPAKFDKITDPDRPFKEQNESADKIVDNALQT
jgi:hypothetical protein